MRPNQEIKKIRRGFTLFIAVITTSIILAIGISIANISLKEFTLSSLMRDSEMAFYAADAGIECAQYWDMRQNAFTLGSAISCMGKTPSVSLSGSTYTFQTDWGTPNVCVSVAVQKTTCGSAPCTIIQSRGYNRSCSGISDPRTVERALQTRY